MKQLPRSVALTIALLGQRLRAGSQDAAAIASADPVLWRDVIACASAHFVLPAIARPAAELAGNAGAVPRDAADFLTACAGANRSRNRELLGALRAAGDALGALGIVPVALKGAAFLLEDASDDFADWRFMQDIDILIPEHRLEACVAALRSLGFTPTNEHYDPEREAHYPPLLSPCGTFSIEVHTRIFAFGDHELGPAKVQDEARPSHRLGSHVLVPSPRHRLMHALAHTQLHNRNYARRRFVLKDLADLDALEQVTGHLEPCFSDHHARSAAEALLATRDLLWSKPPNRSPQAVRWAERAISRLGWSRGRRMLSTPLDFAALEIYRLKQEPGHLRRRLALMTSPTRLADAGASLQTKQRQYLWQ